MLHYTKDVTKIQRLENIIAAYKIEREQHGLRWMKFCQNDSFLQIQCSVKAYAYCFVGEPLLYK